MSSSAAKYGSGASVLCGDGLFDQVQQFGLAGDAERTDEHLAVGLVYLAVADELHGEHIAVSGGVDDEAAPGEDALGLQCDVDAFEFGAVAMAFAQRGPQSSSPLDDIR